MVAGPLKHKALIGAAMSALALGGAAVVAAPNISGPAPGPARPPLPKARKARRKAILKTKRTRSDTSDLTPYERLLGELRAGLITCEDYRAEIEEREARVAADWGKHNAQIADQYLHSAERRRRAEARAAAPQGAAGAQT